MSMPSGPDFRVELFQTFEDSEASWDNTVLTLDDTIPPGTGTESSPADLGLVDAGDLGTIGFGQTTGTSPLATDEAVFFTFTHPGGPLRIDTLGSSLQFINVNNDSFDTEDTYLVLYDENGDVVAEDEDFDNGDILFAFINRTNIAAGNYAVAATGSGLLSAPDVGDNFAIIGNDNAFGTLNVNLFIQPPFPSNITVDQDLGTLILDNPTGFIATPATEINEVNRYEDSSGTRVGDTPAPTLGEYVVSFTLAQDSIVDLNFQDDEDNLNEFYLLEGLATDGAGTATQAIDATEDFGSFGVLSAGTYYLAVDPDDGVEERAVFLTAFAVPTYPASLTVDQTLGSLSIGGTPITFSGNTAGQPSEIDGVLNASGNSLANIEQRAGEVVGEFTLTETATLTLTNFAPDNTDQEYFLLDSLAIDANGNATGGIGYNSEQGYFKDLEPGTYFLAVANDTPAQFMSEEGPFNVEIAAIVPSEIDLATETVVPLGVVGSSVETINLNVCNSDFDTEIAIFDLATGDVIESDDDECDPQSSIERVLGAGDYILVVTGRNTGFFDGLEADLGFNNNNSTRPNQTDSGNYASDTTSSVALNGTLGPNQRDIYSFSISFGGFGQELPQGTIDIGNIADAGEAFNIDGCGTTFDSEIVLWDRNGTRLAINDDNTGFCGSADPSAFTPDNSPIPLEAGYYVVGIAGTNAFFSTSTPFGASFFGTDRFGDYTLDFNGVVVTGTTAAGNDDADLLDAFAFSIGNPCPADQDLNGLLDIDDFSAFVTNFFAGSRRADVDDNDALDIDDFSGFVSTFFNTESCF
ncbi:MAG: hypothetical protein AAF747_03185 [Planctomycetota bacterium]